MFRLYVLIKQNTVSSKNLFKVTEKDASERNFLKSHFDNDFVFERIKHCK